MHKSFDYKNLLNISTASGQEKKRKKKKQKRYINVSHTDIYRGMLSHYVR